MGNEEIKQEALNGAAGGTGKQGCPDGCCPCGKPNKGHHRHHNHPEEEAKQDIGSAATMINQDNLDGAAGGRRCPGGSCPSTTPDCAPKPAIDPVPLPAPRPAPDSPADTPVPETQNQ